MKAYGLSRVYIFHNGAEIFYFNFSIIVSVSVITYNCFSMCMAVSLSATCINIDTLHCETALSFISHFSCKIVKLLLIQFTIV
jgi:hypothetical protein